MLLNRYVDRVSQHSFLGRFIGPDSTILDLGANRGAFAMAMVERYGCRVYAAEPVPHLFREIAGKNARVTCLNVAMGGRSGTTEIRFDRSAHLSASVLPSATTRRILRDDAQIESTWVDMCSLEDFIGRSGAQTIDLLKVDIEGAELDLFDAARADVLDRCRQITVEFHDFWYPELRPHTERVQGKLRAAGFDMIRFTPNNKDVLFVNRQRLHLSPLERFHVAVLVRNVNGFGRMLNVAARRSRSQR